MSARCKKIRLLGVLLLMLPFFNIAMAGSIYDKSAGRAKNPYVDDKATGIGDILTVTIAEHSVIKNSGSRNLDKKTDSSADVSGSFHTNAGTLNGHQFYFPFDLSYIFPDLKMSSKAQNKFDGTAKYDSDRSLSDGISVTVEDVLPNGNLIVLGKRQREIDGEIQTINVSGIVRPSDVAYDNTITSGKVADFHIVYSAKGQEGDFLNAGWLMRILNWLNPY